MEATERDLLKQRDEAAKTTVRNTAYAIMLGVLLAFGITGTSSYIIYRTIAERRRNRQQLERLKVELEQKNHELESIIGTVSHDLRSPLVNIKGFSNEILKDCDSIRPLLNDELSQESQQRVMHFFDKFIPESVGFIQNSAAFMNKLIEGLLKVARAGLMVPHPKQIDMNALLAKVAGNLEFKFREAGITFSVAQLPFCTADEDHVTQIFSNLIDNAIKYRSPLKPGKIKVHGSKERDQSVYCLEDNGVGIALNQQEKVFELFYRLRPEDTKGEGIGLTMVRRMVDRNNGRIWVESEIEKGSKFFVAFPNR
jgi:signal transduction histidine kinase